MIVKGEKILIYDNNKRVCRVDIPDDALRQLIREEIKLAGMDMTKMVSAEESLARIGASRLDENRELRRRLEEAERKLVEVWTDELVDEYARYRLRAFRVELPFKAARDWLAARREEKK